VKFVEDGARAMTKTGPGLPLLQGLPQDVGEEADEDVRSLVYPPSPGEKKSAFGGYPDMGRSEIVAPTGS
jgi:hypothetical protein